MALPEPEMLQMLTYLQNLFFERGMAPHGYCVLWDPALIWTHVVSDALIGFSYLSIPVVLARFLTKRRDVKFSWIIWMFAAFIMACGATHFLSILVFWVPAYGIEGLVKAITAIVSLFTAITVWLLLPDIIALPSPAQLEKANADLRARILERDQAVAALESESAERARVEDMLRQAQKMEAVGQLTSGVAHDFNNLLTIILTNLDRGGRLTTDARLQKAIANATEGAERAAKLTDQLLAFSRKQPALPTHQSLNDIVLGMRSLLDRSLEPGMALHVNLTPDLPAVMIDRNQAENAILNLVLNARDAMPDGGDLTITTRAKPGDAMAQVSLDVSDTGQGIEPGVVGRIFEPFFTTKPVGKGTGLGLSQVYGFAKQSDGDIEVHSVLKEGTTVTLHLPIVREAGALVHDG